MMKLFFWRKKPVKLAVNETEASPDLDNLGDLMLEYDFSIAIQEHNANVSVQGFNLWIN